MQPVPKAVYRSSVYDKHIVHGGIRFRAPHTLQSSIKKIKCNKSMLRYFNISVS